MTPHFFCIMLSNGSICQPGVPPPSPGIPGGPGGEHSLGTGGMSVPALGGHRALGCSNAGNRHSKPRGRPHPQDHGVVCTRTQPWCSSLARQEAQPCTEPCAVLGCPQLLGLTFLEWCLRRWSKMPPFSMPVTQPAVLVRMGSRPTPLIPAWSGCRTGSTTSVQRESLSGGSHSLCKMKTPLYRLSLSCPCPGLLRTGGCPSPPAPSCSQVHLGSTRRCCSPLCVGDSSDCSETGTAGPGQREGSSAHARAAPPGRRAPRDGGGSFAWNKVGTEPT